MVSVPSIVQPLRPTSGAWQRVPIPKMATLGFAGEAWIDPQRSFAVISAVEVAKDADGIDRGPEYHVSIGRTDATRASSADAQDVLREFGLEGAEEDNHVPHGLVRNFWRPVADHLVGIECACKAEEPAIKENKGDYVWRPSE